MAPAYAEAPRWVRSLAAVLGVVVVIALAATSAQALGFGLPGALDRLFPELGVCIAATIATISCAVRARTVEAERRVWTVITASLGCSLAGWLAWAFWIRHLDERPIPSPSDVLWLLFYPGMYVAMAMVLRRSFVRAPGSMWLDGVLAGLAIAAVGVQVAFAPLTGDGGEITAGVAYPLGDLLLLAGIVTVAGLSSWRPGRRWVVYGVAMLLWFVADAVYLRQVAGGSTEMGAGICLLWFVGFSLLGTAAWQPPTAPEGLRVEGLRMLLVPALFSTLALALLAYDLGGDVGEGAEALALLAVATALARTTLTLREIQMLADARHESLTDELTGLPSRRHFHRRLDATLRQAEAEGQPVGLLLFDLDRFKDLNDTLGHGAGDVLLQLVGRRVRDALGRGTLLARLGGDEFAVLLPPGHGRAEALRAAERVRGAILRPFQVEGLELDIGASVGLALFPEHATEDEELLRRADVAMYLAKGAGGGIAVYDPERDVHTRDRLALGRQLRAGLDRGELQLCFQPKVDPQLGRVLGVEALARWQHPGHGLLMPPDFLPIALRSGLMPAVTRHVLDGALEQLAAWRADGLDLTMAVNLAVSDLFDDDLPGDVARILAQRDVPPTCLVLEVTEDGLIADPAAAADTLEQIAALGVRIALDDFGTGFSSLAHLRRLPVDELKIDRSFVMDMAEDEEDAAIVRTTVDLARSVRKRVVAEGVEDEETWRLLAELGCDAIQGYVLSRPLPAAQIRAWLEARREGSVARCAVPGGPPRAGLPITPAALRRASA